MRSIGPAIVAGFFLAAAAATTGSAGQRAEVVNCLAAIVNDEVITLADVRIAESFGLVEAPAGGTADDPARAVLEALIDRKVVIDLAGEGAAFDPVRVQAELDRIAARFGEEGLRRRLEDFGLVFEDLRPYIEERAKVEMIIANRFNRSVGVGLKEIEAVYQGTYVPAEKKAGRTPKPLIEMIESLETEIRAGKIQEQSSLWILNLRDQAEIEIRPDCLKK
jgi:hypothetical protein